MKTSLLTFVAGIAIGAALLKVTDGLISSDDQTDLSGTGKNATPSHRQTSDTGYGRHSRNSRSTGSPLDGQASGGSQGVLDRLAILRNSGDLEISTLELGRIIADIGALSAEEAHAFLRETEKLELNESWYDPLDEIVMTAAQRLIELEGLQVIQDIEDNLYPEFTNRYAEDFGIPMLSFWTNHDPEAARDWVLSKLSTEPGNRGFLGEQLEDDDVLETFFLSYEKQRRGQSMSLLPHAKDEEQKELFLEHSLNARVNLADQSTNLPGLLDQGLALKDHNSFDTLLANVLEKDWQSSKQWVEELEPSPQRDMSVLTVGNSLLENSEVETEEAVEWLMGQEIDNQTHRLTRLSLIQRGLSPPRTNSDFISPVDFVDIPGIPPSSDNIHDSYIVSSDAIGGTIINRNSIDAILNNPLRVLHSDPGQFARDLRKITEENYEGRYTDFINSEIQELGLEYSAPELPNKSPESQPLPEVED